MKIDLGSKPSEVSQPIDDKKVFYPSMALDEEATKQFEDAVGKVSAGDEGTADVTYKVRSVSEDDEGRRVTLDITDMEAEGNDEDEDEEEEEPAPKTRKVSASSGSDEEDNEDEEE